MTRFNLVLLLALLVSSLYLVRVSHDARRVFAELDKARSLEKQLEADHRRLRAEMQVQATPLKIAKTARNKLRMRTATVAVTHYVTYSSPTLPTPSEPAP